MNKKLNLLFYLFSLIISTPFYSQTSCGTSQNSSVQNFNTEDNRYANGISICINVQFHIVRLNDGTGGVTESYVDQINNLLNSHFNPHGIYINKVGIDYINNSTFYNMNDGNFNSLISTNNNANAINFYLTNSCSSWAGKAESILSKNFVLVNSYGLTGVAAHEFGHCLNLWHTFQGTLSGTSGCAENINGSNCNTCGDYVCDTPADARIGVSGGYNPDMTNDMSYYDPNSLDHFTGQQGLRMRNAIGGSPILQATLSSQCATITGANTVCSTSNSQYSLINPQNSTVVWSVSSNLQIVNSLNTGITISAMNATTNGQATITANINGMFISKVIWVGKPAFTVVKNQYSPPTIVWVDLKGLNGVDINSQGITGVLWEKTLNRPVNCGDILIDDGFSTEIGYSGNSCSTSMKITAANNCGSTIIYKTIVGSYKPGDAMKTGSIKTFNIYPNPSKDIVNIDLRNQKNQPEKEAKISGELFDLMGQSKSKVEIIENKATLSVRGLNKGIYVLKIFINNQTESHQIIVE
jgi:hypothetical protein